jgi:hypothetical protein
MTNEKKEFGSVEEVKAYLKEKKFGDFEMSKIDISILNYQQNGQIVVSDEKTVMAGDTISDLVNAGFRFVNVRYTRKEGLYALFFFEKTAEAKAIAKDKMDSLSETVAEIKAARKGCEAIAEA